MKSKLERIEYRRGMLEKGVKPQNLPVTIWRDEDIPSDILKAIDHENLLALGGVYGNEAIGDPVQYDHLKLVLKGDTVEITVFNRAIMLFMSDDERIQRIHRVLCRLEGIR
jgi:hypothetical protein